MLSQTKQPSKSQILKAIENLEENPNDKLNILGDIGIGVVGAAGAGAAVATFGGTSILFGLVTFAPPVGMVVGGAVLGAAAIVGAKKLLFDGNFSQGKRSELLKQLKEQLQEIEAKERASTIEDSDKTAFIVFLKEPVRLNLISPSDAQALIGAVESGQIPIKEGIQLVQEIVTAAKV
ncbi:hypothetical protein JJD41_18970 [Oxynema sp. CENA135]|uniref:hypothetical protein n=1 Tax=Oxynema sp. CENA135 TaxID=984206 RepID=UPI00190AD4C2|nr:hypothetical protein [Oxynema sp. CENA135]MBK4731936.1 hypothetical protein [Oxynema sp. CENA135]